MSTSGSPDPAPPGVVRALVLVVAVLAAVAGTVFILRGGADESAAQPPGPASVSAPRAPEPGPGPKTAPATLPEPTAPPAPAADEPALDLSRPPDSPPPSFASRVSEIEWYEQRLASARRDLQAQLAARERMPALREKAEQAVHPEVNLREWEAASERLERNIARSRHKIEWYEAKLADMRATP